MTTVLRSEARARPCRIDGRMLSTSSTCEVAVQVAAALRRAATSMMARAAGWYEVVTEPDARPPDSVAVTGMLAPRSWPLASSWRRYADSMVQFALGQR